MAPPSISVSLVPSELPPDQFRIPVFPPLTHLHLHLLENQSKCKPQLRGIKTISSSRIDGANLDKEDDAIEQILHKERRRPLRREEADIDENGWLSPDDLEFDHHSKKKEKPSEPHARAAKPSVSDDLSVPSERGDYGSEAESEEEEESDEEEDTEETLSERFRAERKALLQKREIYINQLDTWRQMYSEMNIPIIPSSPYTYVDTATPLEELEQLVMRLRAEVGEYEDVRNRFSRRIHIQKNMIQYYMLLGTASNIAQGFGKKFGLATLSDFSEFQMQMLPLYDDMIRELAEKRSNYGQPRWPVEARLFAWFTMTSVIFIICKYATGNTKTATRIVQIGAQMMGEGARTARGSTPFRQPAPMYPPPSGSHPSYAQQQPSYPPQQQHSQPTPPPQQQQAPQPYSQPPPEETQMPMPSRIRKPVRTQTEFDAQKDAAHLRQQAREKPVENGYPDNLRNKPLEEIH